MCQILVTKFLVIWAGLSTYALAIPFATNGNDNLVRIRISNTRDMGQPSLMIHLTPNNETGTHDTIIDLVRENAHLESSANIPEEPKVMARRSIFDKLFPSSDTVSADVIREAQQPHINPVRNPPQRKYDNPFNSQTVIRPRESRRSLSMASYEPPTFTPIEYTDPEFFVNPDCINAAAEAAPTESAENSDSDVILVNMVADLIRDLLKKYFLRNNHDTRRTLSQLPAQEANIFAQPSEVNINPNNFGIDILQENK